MDQLRQVSNSLWLPREVGRKSLRMDMESTLRIAAVLKNLAEIRQFIQETATKLGGDQAAIHNVLVAVNEAATNIMVHGYQEQPGSIEIEVGRKGKALVICLRDQAPPFDPTTTSPPDLTLPLEQRPFGGLGIHLIRQFMDEMTHRTRPENGNELTLIKKNILDNISNEETNEHYS